MTRKEIGHTRWNKRVIKAIDNMRALTLFDHLYIGGGNSRRVLHQHLPDDVTVVDNTAGILGRDPPVGAECTEATARGEGRDHRRPEPVGQPCQRRQRRSTTFRSFLQPLRISSAPSRCSATSRPAASARSGWSAASGLEPRDREHHVVEVSESALEPLGRPGRLAGRGARHQRHRLAAVAEVLQAGSEPVEVRVRGVLASRPGHPPHVAPGPVEHDGQYRREAGFAALALNCRPLPQDPHLLGQVEPPGTGPVDGDLLIDGPAAPVDDGGHAGHLAGVQHLGAAFGDDVGQHVEIA